MDLPCATRARKSLDDMAKAVTSRKSMEKSLCPASVRSPSSPSSKPGRVTAMKRESPATARLSRHRTMFATASAPVMKNSSTLSG